MDASEKLTEFCMSPQFGNDPAALTPDDLIARAEILGAFALRLELFANQRVRPSAELRERVVSMLSRYADVPASRRLQPRTPLTRYFEARHRVVIAARRIGITRE